MAIKKEKFPNLPEGILQHVAKTISGYRSSLEIGELFRISGYGASNSIVSGTKWKWIYGRFIRLQQFPDLGPPQIKKIIEIFADPTQWIGKMPKRQEAMDALNEGLALVELQLDSTGKLIKGTERIVHSTESSQSENPIQPLEFGAGPIADTQLNGNTKKVFVVHGRNEQIRKDMFSWLRAIGLEPIEWIEAVAMTEKAAPYVGEILDAALANAQAIVVVMTPDDEAHLRVPYLKKNDPAHERELSPQPRANVLFEAGLALGRNPDRTLLVEIGSIRPFSDVAGRHAIRLDNSVAKRQDLANRLKTAGCAVNLNGTDWHTEGDFVVPEFDAQEQHEVPDSPREMATKSIPDENLPAEEQSILTLIAEMRSGNPTFARLESTLKMNPIKLEHYLDDLETKGYIV